MFTDEKLSSAIMNSTKDFIQPLSSKCAHQHPHKIIFKAVFVSQNFEGLRRIVTDLSKKVKQKNSK